MKKQFAITANSYSGLVLGDNDIYYRFRVDYQNYQFDIPFSGYTWQTDISMFTNSIIYYAGTIVGRFEEEHDSFKRALNRFKISWFTRSYCKEMHK